MNTKDIEVEDSASSSMSSFSDAERGIAYADTNPTDLEKTKNMNIVDFDGPNDPADPLNWSLKRKIITTLLYGYTTMGATWGSSVYTSATAAIAEEFDVGDEVSTLGLTTFLLGFAVGPLLWAPFSEVYGRKLAVLPPYLVATCFCFGTATAKDLQTIMITRFFFGFFGSVPVTCTGGVMGDIWTAEKRAIAMLVYSFASIAGPILSPIAGAAFVQSHLGWRWTHYLTGIMMASILLVDTLVIKESYREVILVTKARALRYKLQDWPLHAKHEERDFTLNEFTHKYLIRPFRLFMTPICFLMVLYASFVFGIVYLNFSAITISFSQVRGWSPVVSQLPLLATLFGGIIGGYINYMNQSFYIKRLLANNHRPVPEARLPPMMIGSFALAAGLFIFAWTSTPTIPWIAPCIVVCLMGVGFFTIFQGTVNYMVDMFQKYGASAIAANTVLRNVFGGVFPLFAQQMYHKLGVGRGAVYWGFWPC